MEWARPEYLYLILPLAAAWLALSLYARRCRQRAAAAFVAQAMWPKILPPASRARFWVKLLLREAALVAGLAALAGPRFGAQYEEVIPHGSDLYILIDVSRSMLAEDVPPSRLGRAKADVASLVNRLEGERVGLIAFAGQAVVKCPLTVDYDSFRRSLDELDPASAPRGGTAIGDAIRKALEVFQARAERDQAILLITDGDDQQSYPLEAAAVAAERQVTIFTVGLGDADHGARVPKGGQTPAFVEYEGQQVWSKLDGSLLKDIALKTSGVYVPVGTRSYDLGELYADHLKGRRGGDDETRKRLRRSEQFQIFMALSLLALLADLLISPSPVAAGGPVLGFHRTFVDRDKERGRQGDKERGRQGDKERGRQGDKEIKGVAARLVVVSPFLPLSLSPCLLRIFSGGAALLIIAFLTTSVRAEDPNAAVREGLQLYRQDDFDKARDKFAAARHDFEKGDARKAAIAAFDEACAAHRKGDVAQAREAYLQAGLAHDKKLAAAAHFNLGTLSAEEARRVAGEHPEQVPPEKRQEILDQLAGAVASFRHSLELQPDDSRPRRDIELVRQWIRYYSAKWHERDRQKRREEANLVTFLEFLMETQRALKESVTALPATAPADAFAELKRLQDELHEEIEPLKDKIRADLQPAQTAPGNQPAAASQELEQGITLLQGWADAAGEKMSSAARHLGSRRRAPATADQQSAIDELEKMWEAVIPFQPLLTRDLADQTQIARALEPKATADSKSEQVEPIEKGTHEPDEAVAPAASQTPGSGPSSITTTGEDLARLVELQEQTRRRTQLLKLKAEAELDRWEKSPPADAAQPAEDLKPEADDSPTGETNQPKPVDPAEIKAGLQTAIDLAPRAVEKMDESLQALQQKDRQTAYPAAEEARKILEEIQQAQPKNKQDQDQKQNQDQKDDQKKDDQKKSDEKKEDEKKDKEKQDDEKNEDKQDQEKKKDGDQKQDEQKKSGDKKENQKQPQVSRDQVEEALRKVRERQQEKRERDRKMKARVSGKAYVDKDW